MTLVEFLSDQLGRLLLNLATTAVTTAFLLATGTPVGVIVIILLFWLLIFLTIETTEYLKCRARLRELDDIMEGLDQKHLFAACAPTPRSPYERKLFALMRRSGKAMIEAVSDAQSTQREYREYIESWVHEIKTPMTAARLICQSAAPDLRRKLTYELSYIDAHVERALFYARAESPERDFIIRQTLLADMAAQTIERHRTLLIQNGVRIETEELAHIVYTDDKWVCFLLGQLLQNAVRYRSEAPVIHLRARQLGRQIQLTVQDNGIGIPAHELPRIFDRGFTGTNGRLRGGSTGMGLYLCRRLADSLEINLQVQSQEGEGTCVTLTFPAKETLTKV